jgi:hypothetical protein
MLQARAWRKLGRDHAARCFAEKRFSRSELASTETLESDIAALASTGESCQPVQG